MNDFLNNLKADLTDRRLLPLVAVTVVALLAAVAWAVLAGGSTSSPSSPSVRAVVLPAGPVGTSGLVATSVTPEKAVAETASGFAAQRHGSSRDPFTPLPGTPGSPGTASASSAAKTASASTSSSSSPSSSSSSSTKSSGSEKSSSTPSTPSKPATPQTVYNTAVLFGVVPAGTPPANAQLSAYPVLKLSTPLPNATSPLVVYRGVTKGKTVSATFTLVGEAILHGQGSCLPEAQNCQAIDLAPGQAEQLEYTPPSGQPIVYELRVVSITAITATAAAARRALAARADGQSILKTDNLLALPYLVYAEPGLLVFPRKAAAAARAHSSRAPRRGR